LEVHDRVITHIDVAVPINGPVIAEVSPITLSPRNSLQERVVAGGRRLAKNMSAASQMIKETTSPMINHVYTEVKRTVNGIIQRMMTEPSAPSPRSVSSPRSARRSARSRARLLNQYSDQLTRLRDMGLVTSEDEDYEAARLLRQYDGDLQQTANELIRLAEERRDMAMASQMASQLHQAQDVSPIFSPGISA